MLDHSLQWQLRVLDVVVVKMPDAATLCRPSLSAEVGERAKAWRDKLLRRRPSALDISQQDSQGNWIPFETGRQAMQPRVGTFNFGILYSDAGKKLCSLSGAAGSQHVGGVVCRPSYLLFHWLSTSLTSCTGCRAA